MKRKIWLGVLRCDTHAYWYAPLLPGAIVNVFA
jgi:hypothetical protein